jgi:dipeptidase D
MPLDDPLASLQPTQVWSHFARLCAIPRPSLGEDAVRRHLMAWAGRQGIAHRVDGVGNLILCKPASPGCEDKPGVILQGHLDMVCQANAGTRHDFTRDAIRTQIRDGWVVADDTTLGADNGIGVALALAVLETPGLVHPPLEVLLTVNEESGMDGARGLTPGTLQGSLLINLDTEEWGQFYLGCAGGVDAVVSGGYDEEPVPAGYRLLRVTVSGLQGGHSGVDIHLGRGNAIKLLTAALLQLAGAAVRLVELHGGTARNAIPREAYALVALPEAEVAAAREALQGLDARWKREHAATDAGVALSCQVTEDAPGHASSLSETARLLYFLDRAPNGVKRLSEEIEGVVDTSDNIGVLSMQAGRFATTLLVRSLHGDCAEGLADEIVRTAASHGLRCEKEGAYPGWTPNSDSALLAHCQRVYTDLYGTAAGLQVIHAGLECGLLAASHPHLDMVSFGPDIRGAHAPGERVEIASVGRCWAFLQAVLCGLAE